MTYSEFERSMNGIDLNDFWKDSRAFNCLRLFWSRSLGSCLWFSEQQWQIDGLSGVERPEGDAFLESYSLTAGSLENWNQARFVFTTRFLSTARLLYDVHVLKGTIIPPDDAQNAADHLKNFLAGLTSSDYESAISLVVTDHWKCGSKVATKATSRYFLLSNIQIKPSMTSCGSLRLRPNTNSTRPSVGTLLRDT